MINFYDYRFEQGGEGLPADFDRPRIHDLNSDDFYKGDVLKCLRESVDDPNMLRVDGGVDLPKGFDGIIRHGLGNNNPKKLKKEVYGDVTGREIDVTSLLASRIELVVVPVPEAEPPITTDEAKAVADEVSVVLATAGRARYSANWGWGSETSMISPGFSGDDVSYAGEMDLEIPVDIDRGDSATPLFDEKHQYDPLSLAASNTVRVPEGRHFLYKSRAGKGAVGLIGAELQKIADNRPKTTES